MRAPRYAIAIVVSLGVGLIVAIFVGMAVLSLIVPAPDSDVQTWWLEGDASEPDAAWFRVVMYPRTDDVAIVAWPDADAPQLRTLDRAILCTLGEADTEFVEVPLTADRSGWVARRGLTLDPAEILLTYGHLDEARRDRLLAALHDAGPTPGTEVGFREVRFLGSLERGDVSVITEHADGDRFYSTYRVVDEAAEPVSLGVHNSKAAAFGMIGPLLVALVIAGLSVPIASGATFWAIRRAYRAAPPLPGP